MDCAELFEVCDDLFDALFAEWNVFCLRSVWLV